MLSSIFYIILEVAFVEERANVMCMPSHRCVYKNTGKILLWVFHVDDNGDDVY